jgi:GNAT superfamily N-acetyltransferase
MSMYADYVSEREGVSAIERDYGFATYLCDYHARDLYICDFFIVAHLRRSGVSQQLLNELLEAAKSDNLLTMSAACRVGAPGTDAAIAGLIKYGFTVAATDASSVYLKFKIS